jgi:DNA (cytosine-5)-methyltransferase 1
MRVGSLFSGIGGLDLGLERAGMQVVWQSEINPYASRVLAKHWPDTPNLGDITRIDWSSVEPVDLICGGYPCQPFSTASHGRRVATNLWPHYRDAIHNLRPRYVLLENVAAHLGLGFTDVLGDLAGLGFDAEWSVVPACSMGAAHMRRRLFCVAYTNRRREPASRLHAETPRQPTNGDACRPWPTSPARMGMAHGIPHRVDRLRALGNAVVPQVAEWIGHQIMTAAS